MLFLLNSLYYLWCFGKCLSKSRKNILPLLVFTLEVKGGLKHKMFLLLSFSLRRLWCKFDIFAETTVFKCFIVVKGSFIKALFITWNIRYYFTDQARLKNMLVCRHPGLIFRVHRTGGEKIALILINNIFVTKKKFFFFFINEH